MVQVLVSINLLLESLDLALIYSMVAVYKLDLLYDKHFTVLNIHSFINLSSCALSDKSPLFPLDQLTLNFGVIFTRGCNKLLLEL